MENKNQPQAQDYPENQSLPPHLKPIDHIKQPLPKRLIAWAKNNPKQSIPLAAAGLCIIIGAIFVFWPRSSMPSPAAIPTPQKPLVFYSPLTGRKVSEDDSKLPVIAAIIENSPEARPQSGLQQAGVVFESVAEGGITRFLALYQEDKPAQIGPVRSVRPHFASWVAAFDAGLAHVGGSDIPLKKLRSGQIKDFDQFTNDSAYWRSPDRYAPHNMYTSHQRLSSLAKNKKYTASTFTAWERQRTEEAKKDQPKEEKEQRTRGNESSNRSSSDKEAQEKATPATNIAVPVSTGQFAARFTWDSKKETYARSQGGLPHIDREKGRITPAVVIVFQVPHDIIRESNGYSYPDVNSRGRAWIFQNGTVESATWKKSGDKQQITFANAAGDDVKLMPGQTWLTAIRPDTKPSW